MPEVKKQRSYSTTNTIWTKACEMAPKDGAKILVSQFLDSLISKAYEDFSRTQKNK